MKKFTKEELIEYLKKDLDRQREEYKKTHDEDPKNSDLTLRIGSFIDFEFEFDFEFDFKEILKKLGVTKNDENFKLICPYKVDFNHTTFSAKVNFYNTTFSANVEFIATTFIQDVKFNHTTFIQDVKFNHTTFIQDVKFLNTTFSANVKFATTTFSADVNFLDTTFIQDVKFLNTIFSADVDFNHATFSADVNFLDTTFSADVDFYDITCKKTIKFDNIKIDADKSYLTFRNINYDRKAKKFLEVPEDSTIAIINTVMDKRIDFNNVHIAKLNLKGSNIIGVLNRINLKAKSENWETACILKNEELKRNNTKQALEYHAEEKDFHMIDSWEKKEYGVWFSLFLSKIVNNHGQSWFQAFCFTLWVWICSFTVFYLPTYLFWDIFKWEVILVVLLIGGVLLFLIKKFLIKKFDEEISKLCEKLLIYIFYLFSIVILAIVLIMSVVDGSLDVWEYVKNLIEYFVPTNYKSLTGSYITNESIGWWVKIGGIGVYMFGKIFVPYGVFEIIKAFRKYK